MRILDNLEQKAFDAPPVFNSVERKKYVYLPAELSTYTESLRTPTNQVCFLLTLGYFKAANRFFVRTAHEADIDYVASQLEIQPRHIDIQSYEETTGVDPVKWTLGGDSIDCRYRGRQFARNSRRITRRCWVWIKSYDDFGRLFGSKLSVSGWRGS